MQMMALCVLAPSWRRMLFVQLEGSWQLYYLIRLDCVDACFHSLRQCALDMS